MSIEEAYKIKKYLEEYETFAALPDKLIKIHREGDHDKLLNIACELATELKNICESKIYQIRVLTQDIMENSGTGILACKRTDRNVCPTTTFCVNTNTNRERSITIKMHRTPKGGRSFVPV